MQSAIIPALDVERGESGWTPRRALWAVIGLSTALRLVWDTFLGPAIDEPYYIEYIQHPAWSYFDHPPMVALAGMPGLAIVGDAFSIQGLRLGFIALFAGSSWLIARITSRYYGPWAGVWAALALNISGYFGMAVGMIALPDGPLLFFWLLTIERLSVALEEPKRLVPWLGVGIGWGGAMLSKYHAVLLPVGALLFLSFRPVARRCLKMPGPYLASLVGLAMFTPVIRWNATHGWASFLFQGGRASASTGLRLDHLAVAIGAEALYMFPWFWVALVSILVRLIWRGPRRWDEGEAFLISQAIPALVLFHAVATFQRIMPYWPLFGFISLFPLMGRNWARQLESGRVAPQRWVALLTLIPIVLAALISIQSRFGLFEDSNGRLLGVIPPRHDPTIDLMCWGQVADDLERRGLLDEAGTFLFTDSWDKSARVAWAVRGKAHVACYNTEPRSYNFWSRPDDYLGHDGIYLEDDPRPGQLPNFAKYFREYESIGSAKIRRGGVVIREVPLYRGICQIRAFPFDGRPQDPVSLPGSAMSRTEITNATALESSRR